MPVSQTRRVWPSWMAPFLFDAVWNLCPKMISAGWETRHDPLTSSNTKSTLLSICMSDKTDHEQIRQERQLENLENIEHHECANRKIAGEGQSKRSDRNRLSFKRLRTRAAGRLENFYNHESCLFFSEPKGENAHGHSLAQKACWHQRHQTKWQGRNQSCCIRLCFCIESGTCIDWAVGTPGQPQMLRRMMVKYEGCSLFMEVGLV